jgi:hypothetical protein
MVNVEEAYQMPMHCRGGEHCCNKDTNCTVGDGDCNTDEDCPGTLICGTNNCLTGENFARSVLVNKGLWDPEDDCCERACKPAHPCEEGGGTCLTDSDCRNPGWAKCGASCLDQTRFPRNIFIKNTETFGFLASDKCCYRVCNKRYNICGNNQIGCWEDEDCGPGLYCKRNVAQPFCTDINECDPTNTKMFGTKFCGQNTVCTNTIGSFTCTCNAGYENFTAWEGCVDKDECSPGGVNNCDVNTAACWNTPGSFVCTCQLGLTGNPLTGAGCTDINECSDSRLNNCITGLSSPVYNTETFGEENMKFFFIGKAPDGYSLTVQFAVSGPSTASLSLCDGPTWNSCYELILGNKLNTEISLKNCKRTTPSQCVDASSLLHSNTADIALHQNEFRTFWITTQLNMQGALNVSAGSATDPAAIFFIDVRPISVSHVGLRNLGFQETIYWRNLGVKKTTQTCTNTFGSYVCTDNAAELAGIGIGGSRSTDPNNVIQELMVVTSNQDSCRPNILPNLAGRFAPGAAVVGSKLFVCGGGATSSVADCRVIELDSYNPLWQSSSPLPTHRREFVMLSYLDSFYVFGGYSFSSSSASCLSTAHSYNTTSAAWSPRTSMPVGLYRHCGVLDSQFNNFWILGGLTCSEGSAGVYRYFISNNSWTAHSTLPWTTTDTSCGIIKKTNGARWLLAVGGGIGAGAVAYLDLTYNNSTLWRTVSSFFQNMQTWRMTLITPNPYSALLIGGNSQRFGVNLRNFWNFNQKNNVFEDSTYFLSNEMYQSAWAMTQKSYKSLQSCFTYVTYAAAGFGSGSFSAQWDVLLRSRTMGGDPKLPARCDNGIPDLVPARHNLGITSVGYRLIVCGGYQPGQPTVNLCYWLDTSSSSPIWSSMAPMLIARNNFLLVTYGDAVYAIGGCSTPLPNTNQVDRWTQSKGWVNMANYPNINIYAYCAVADEGYDAIYVTGGVFCANGNGCWQYGNVYKYIVSTDTWVGFNGLPWSRQYHGCGIIRRRTDNHRMIIVVGHDWGSEIVWFNLSTNQGWSHYHYLDRNWARATWISLTPYESFIAGGNCDGWGESSL